MHRPSSLVLAAACAVLGFLLVTAVGSVGDTRRAAQPRRGELISLIERRRSLVGEEDQAVHALRGEVAATQRLVARRSQADRAAADNAADVALKAGTVALRGRGLTVRLEDSAREPTTEQDAGAYRIHDSDLQLVVNALFAAGAEAVAVNDNRLVATSPIRAAGDTIVVNFRPLNPPYRVTAIAADRSTFDDSSIATRFRRWTGLFGLGFSVQQGNVTVPAYTGRVAITSAQPG